jgi:hypothetical protein
VVALWRRRALLGSSNTQLIAAMITMSDERAHADADDLALALCLCAAVLVCRFRRSAQAATELPSSTDALTPLCAL